MKEWFTAAEISALALPGLPSTERNIRRTAQLKGWQYRDHDGKGGGREYPLSALPTAARANYVARHIQVVNVPVVIAPGTTDMVPAATATAAEQRDARLAILAAADRFAVHAGIGRKRADALFCAGYETGAMDVPAWVRAAVRSLTPRTLARWRAAHAEGATHRLAVDKGATRRGKGVLETANGGAVKTFCLALLSRNPLFSADHIRGAVGGHFGGELVSASGEVVPLPPLRTFQEALKTWKTVHKVDLAVLTDPDGFKSKYKLSGRNSFAHIQHVNQLWMIDASPVDMLCVDGRHNVYVAVDVYSRRMMAYITRTPRAEGVGLLMRRALLTWGVPQEVKTDNGSDFVARATRSLFDNIRVDRVTSAPFSPEEKAFVERAIKTFQHTFVRMLDGFVGHSVADRKIIEARKSFAQRLGADPREALCVELTAAQVQSYADEWIRLKYEHRPHEGLGRSTPFQMAATARDIRMVDARALDVLLAPVAGTTGLRTVTKYGVRVDGSHYLTPYIMPGTQVLVRMDPMDLGRAMLFDPSGNTYLGEAICPVLEGIDPKAAVAAAKKAQAEYLAERTAPIRKDAAKIGKGPRAVDLMLRQAAREAGTLVELPKRIEAHTTPALEAAAQAARPRQLPKPALSQDVMQMRAQLLAEQSEPGGAEIRFIRSAETPRQRYQRAVALERRVAAGETLAADETQFLVQYVQGSEYKGHKATYGEIDDLPKVDEV